MDCVQSEQVDVCVDGKKVVWENFIGAARRVLRLMVKVFSARLLNYWFYNKMFVHFCFSKIKRINSIKL